MTAINKTLMEQIDGMARAGDTVGEICKTLGVTTADVDDVVAGYGEGAVNVPIAHEAPCKNCYQTWRHMRRSGALPYCHHRAVWWTEAADGAVVTKPMSRREYRKQLQPGRPEAMGAGG
jgi:hypothetical protein